MNMVLPEKIPMPVSLGGRKYYGDPGRYGVGESKRMEPWCR